MRVVMLSDAHAAGPQDDSQVSLVRWLDRLEADELLLLGDVFHHWWGFPGVVWPPYLPLVEALGRVTARGITLRYLPGNHDFVLGDVLLDDVGVLPLVPGSVTRDGLRLWLAHGDEADDSRGYQWTRRVLRGRPFAGLMRTLGPERGHRLLRRLAGVSRQHGGELTPLLDRQRAWALPLLGAEADVVVMGHIHVPRVESYPQGQIVYLGDWVEHRTWLRVDDGVPALLQGEQGLPFEVARP